MDHCPPAIKHDIFLYTLTLEEFITTQIFIYQNLCQQANTYLLISISEMRFLNVQKKNIKIAWNAEKASLPNQARAAMLHYLTLSLAFGRCQRNYTGTKCSEGLILVLNVFLEDNSRLLYANGVSLWQWQFSICKTLNQSLNSKRKQKLNKNHKTVFAA